ncbi:MAG: YbhB/YbcL family Raf kinase inhibitor-like protein [Desulfomonilia bacterium]|nr:YbhB/YbcL family Raf kinase inhibitor-like protein [Desulfomonilia bacterium]
MSKKGSDEVRHGLKLVSPAFDQGEMIPSEYTCDGSNMSPPLEISGVPAGTKSLVLICDDPDAPMPALALLTFVHWVYYNIPPEVSSLDKNIGHDERPSAGGIQGKNGYRKVGYGGPCPPFGTHRYFFRLYALDTLLDLPPGAKKKQVLKAMEGHIITQTELMGTYKKR